MDIALSIAFGAVVACLVFFVARAFLRQRPTGNNGALIPAAATPVSEQEQKEKQTVELPSAANIGNSTTLKKDVTLSTVLIPLALIVAGVVITLLYFFQNPPERRLEADFMKLAKEIVQDNLSDPASAQFDEVRVVIEPVTNMPRVCGLVNAKNRLGGYVGKTPFVVYNGIAYILGDKKAILRAGEGIVKLCFPNL